MRIHHRLQEHLKAMGAWASVVRKELAARIGELAAGVKLGPGRWRREHPPGAGGKMMRREHSIRQQGSIGARSANRRRVWFCKWAMNQKV